MPDDRPCDPAASTGSPRLTALALLVAGVATAGLALHPGLALADGGHGHEPAARGGEASRVALALVSDDDGATADAGDDDPFANDDASTDGLSADDDVVLGDDDPSPEDDGAADDASADDDAGAEDDPVDAVVVDRRGREQRGPKRFAATKAARASGLRWTGWNAASATGRGRLVVRTTGRRAKRLRGTGTVVLGRLTVCADGTPVYRRAVFTVAHRRPVTVALPGCAALDD